MERATIWIRFIVRTNLWVALCFAAFVWQTCILLEVDDIHLPIFCFFSTLLTYNAQRIYKFRKNNFNSPFNNWIENHISLLLLLCIVAILGILYSLPKLLTADYLLLFFPLVFSVFYVVKIPFFSINKSLREMPFLKIFVITISWVLLGVFLPINRLNSTIETVDLILLTLEKFCFVLAITIPFDIRDVQYDPIQIQTIPHKLGLRRSFLLSYAFLWISFLFLCTRFYWGFGGTVAMNAIVYIIAFLWIKKSKTSTYEDFHGFYLDGIFLLQSILVFIAYKYHFFFSY